MAHGIDLDKLDAAALNQLIQDATAKRDEKMEGARQALREEMETRAAALGLSLDGLFGRHEPSKAAGKAPRGARKPAGGQVAAKYRDKDGNEWTGRGRPPRWLSEAEKNGARRDEFLIG